MEPVASRKSDWVLTSEALERLLHCLDTDRARAGERYEQFRRKLIEFFEARGSHSPADHADEAINRVARKITEGETIQDVGKYFYGVARLLWMELLREKAKSPLPLDTVAAPASDDDEKANEIEQGRAERRFECFDACLKKLPTESRAFIINYYKEEKGAKIKGRKRQAETIGVSLNALRLRAARLRSGLERCVRECLKHAPGDEAAPEK